jgi:hypothetical protein
LPANDAVNFITTPLSPHAESGNAINRHNIVSKGFIASIRGLWGILYPLFKRFSKAIPSACKIMGHELQKEKTLKIITYTNKGRK